MPVNSNTCSKPHKFKLSRLGCIPIVEYRNWETERAGMNIAVTTRISLVIAVVV